MLAKVRARHNCLVVFLYVHEAHAKELWPLSASAPPVHKNLRERLVAADGFLARWPSFASQVQCTYVDDMSNKLLLDYGLWPERMLLLRHGVAEWASDFEEYGEKEVWDAAQRVFADSSVGIHEAKEEEEEKEEAVLRVFAEPSGEIHNEEDAVRLVFKELSNETHA